MVKIEEGLKIKISRRGFIKAAGIGGLGLLLSSGDFPSPEIPLPRKINLEFVESVASATRYRYDAKDDEGHGLDTLKIIENPPGDYLGVYHTNLEGVFYTKLARSFDLLNWQHVVDFDSHASQPTIERLSDGGFLVAYEKDSANGNWLKFRYYQDLSSLVKNAFQREFDASQTLSPWAEGTPNIYSAKLLPDISNSQIDVGFHYYKDHLVNRQAQGRLVNFNSWTSQPDTHLNTLMEKMGIQGSIGDRDHFFLRGKEYLILEAQPMLVENDWSAWRSYLYDYEEDAFTLLKVKTHQGSVVFANPTFTSITSPCGKPAFVITLFIHAAGAAPGEGGELIYYREEVGGASNTKNTRQLPVN